MTELYKFKRRLIRSVERLLIKEKLPEAEVWEALKKETGNNCKNIWMRMKSLTLKKLKWLLLASDVEEDVPPAAKMTGTDWLLVDLVLVHQDDVDFIGRDESTKEQDHKALVDLFELVEKYEIEMKHGDHLADAWSDLTQEYNLFGRSCSPMLLQRRWFQVKQWTRDAFYNFWYAYRGTHTRLAAAEPFKPTPLLIDVGKRYKQLVTCKFVLWEDLIQMRCVIMADEFENLMKKKSTIPPTAKKKEDKPDIEVIEPVIETIDLDDSDTETSKNIETPVKSPEITIKEEPLDFDEDSYTLTSAEKKTIYDEVLESLEKEDLDNLDVAVVDNVDNVDDSNKAIDLEPDSEATPDIVKEENFIPENVDTIESEEIVLPQITNVFGNVNVSTETIGKLAMIADLRDGIINDSVAIKEININNVENVTEINKDLVLNKDDKHIDLVEEDVEDVKPDISQFSLGEVATDINFADDGIEFMDDGIIDNEEDEPTDAIAETIKAVVERAMEQIEDPKIDEKLLLVPTVYLQRLENCIKLDSYNYVDNRHFLDIIDSKSKPIIKTQEILHEEITIKIEEENSLDANSDDDDNCNFKRVKLSSYLLQKPRTRQYNPFQLCKNPDFNTRLKRLNIGFFGYPTNCVLLKSCKPLTVDLCNAFESRLVQGTLYLEKGDAPIEVNNDVVNQKVAPTALTIQSLINNAVEQNITQSSVRDISDKSPDSEVVTIRDNTTKSLDSEVVTISDNITKTPDCEVTGSILRNKVINLPDISEIRKINQHLLTAEVTPIVINNTPSRKAIEIDPKPTSKAAQNKNLPAYKKPGPKSRKTPIPPWTGLPWTTQVPWNASVKLINYSEDNTLLTIDALNKMLFVFCNTGEEKAEFFKKVKPKIKKNKDLWAEKHSLNPQKLTDVTPSTSEIIVKTVDQQTPINNDGKEQENDNGKEIKEDNNDKEKKSNSEKPKPTAKRKERRRTKKPCCWAAKTLEYAKNERKRIYTHDCPHPYCNCCCMSKLERFVKTEYNITDEEYDEVAEPYRSNFMRRIIVNSKTTALMCAASLLKNVVVDHCVSDDEVSTQVYSHTTKPAVINLDDYTKDISSNKRTEDIPVTIDLDADTDNTVPTITTSEDKTKEITTITTDAVNKESDENLDELKQDTDKGTYQEIVQVEVANNGAIIKESSCAPSIKVNIFNRDTPPVSNMPFKVVAGSRNRPKLIINPLPVVSKPVEEPVNRTIVTRKVKTYPGSRDGNPINTIKSRNETVILVNRKARFGLSNSDSPINLGHNKILLTTVKIPRILKSLEVFEDNPDKILYLPQGVQLTLLPCNTVSYILDPHKIANAEELTLLPEIISAVQKRVNKMVVRLKDAPVIDFYEGLPKTPPQNVPAENDDHNTQTGDSKNPENLLEIASSDSNENIDISKDTPNKEVDESQVSNDQTTTDNQNEDNNSIDIMKPTNAKQFEENQNVDTNITDVTESTNSEQSQNVDPNITDIAEQDKTENSDEANHTNDITETEDASKPKNILSDLMEMSGISADDFATPQQEETQNVTTIVPPPATTIVPPPATTIVTSLLDAIVRPYPTTEEFDDDKLTTTVNTPCGLLYCVTSFMQLKYAVNNNGKFFKLDLGTGILMNINVRVKQKETRSRSLAVPNSVIDLTDDVPVNTPVIPEKDHLMLKKTQVTPEKVRVISKETPTTSSAEHQFQPSSKSLLQSNQSLLIDKQHAKQYKTIAVVESRGEGVNRSILIDKQSVKPVKLFKSSKTGSPLRAYLKERYRRVFQKHFQNDDAKIITKMNRDVAQSRSKDDDESIDLNSSDETVPDAEKESRKRGDLSDSSDDEPLSKVAKKNKKAGPSGRSLLKLLENKEPANDEDNNDEEENSANIDEVQTEDKNTTGEAESVTLSEIQTVAKDSTLQEEDNGRHEAEEMEVCEEEHLDFTDEESDVSEPMSLVEEPMDFTDESDDSDHCILGV